jgi:hypothetical protein
MPEKSNVATPKLLRQIATLFLCFALARQTELQIRESSGLLNHYFDALAGLK